MLQALSFHQGIAAESLFSTVRKAQNALDSARDFRRVRGADLAKHQLF
jgi:hypothetical protein